MVSKLRKLLKWVLVALAASLVTLLGVRAYDAQRGPPLELWHTFVPHEPTAGEIDKADWQQYLAAEGKIFAEVRTEVTDKLDPESREPANRYFADSPIYPGKFATDWNRSYVMEPAGKPAGAVVLLHTSVPPYLQSPSAANRPTHDVVAAAGEVLDELSARGVAAVTLSELIPATGRATPTEIFHT